MATKNEFGSNWWAKRWNKTLDGFGYASRLQRGKTYARAGNVLEMNITPGKIEAKVRGSRPRPYKISINVKVLSKDQWGKIIGIMSEKAIFSSKLLNGEMPENIEEAFENARLPLFPERSSDLITDCSCPDFANPCKHIAAVYYMLGTEFDKDPFIIFRLRGMDKENLMENLRILRGRGNETTKVESGNDKGALDNEEPVKTLQDLEEELRSFTGIDDKLKKMEFSFKPPQVKMSLIKRLGAPSSYNSPITFQNNISFFYLKAAERALQCVEEK